MEEMHPELKDVLEMINRYNASHTAGCFVFNFIGFKDKIDESCGGFGDCGQDYKQVDDSKSLLGAFGRLDILRVLLNDLRDVIEDSSDENGIVNL